MQKISMNELRADLAWTASRVQRWENFILHKRWVNQYGLVNVEWAKFIERIEQIDAFIQTTDPTFQQTLRGLIIKALIEYANPLNWSPKTITLTQLLWKIGEDMHQIMMGESKKKELKLN